MKPRVTDAKTTPAPPGPTAPLPECPYESLRLGLGLRPRDASELRSLGESLKRGKI